MQKMFGCGLLDLCSQAVLSHLWGALQSWSFLPKETVKNSAKGETSRSAPVNRHVDHVIMCCLHSLALDLWAFSRLAMKKRQRGVGVVLRCPDGPTPRSGDWWEWDKEVSCIAYRSTTWFVRLDSLLCLEKIHFFVLTDCGRFIYCYRLV